MLVDISLIPTEKETTLIGQIEQYLKQCYRAGVCLRCTGASLDHVTMENDIGDLLIDLVGIVKDLTDRRAELVSVIEDLLEQHRRQDDMEACALWQSYPDKFPEWDRAWDNAREVLDG